MNKLLIPLLVTGFIVTGYFSYSQIRKDKSNKLSKFEIKRGVNLSHWLSQDFGWESKYSFIKESDIRFIESIGYDHVRIPIDEQEMWDSSGAPIKIAFKYLTDCLDWCAKYNLRAIVDLHIIRAHHFNASNDGTTNTLWENPSAQENFIKLWIQLSEVLIKYPNNMVAYEILNEAVAPNHEDWNKLMNKAVAEIRKSEPERILVIGANMWQMAPNLKYLKLPEGDKNIILSFHTYSPLAFTHYKTSWTQLKFYNGPVHYPGQIITNEEYKKYIDTTNSGLVSQTSDAKEFFNKERLVEVFKDGIEFAKSKKLQLYCGEFGCIPTVDRKDRLMFYNDMILGLEENNIAWANWEYKGDFGIYFWDGEKQKSLEPDIELIKILLQFSDKQKLINN